ncbi:MAG: TraR/DksA family transcriptional regulator [Thermaurantiacus tibetensis]
MGVDLAHRGQHRQPQPQRQHHRQHSLARIADGSYGTCVVCGGPISEARLKALPTAVTCIDCAAGGDGR